MMTTSTPCVLQLLPALDQGGVELCVLETANALVKAHFRSVVASSGGRLVNTLTAQGSTHITLPLSRKSPLTLSQVWAIRRLIQQYKPDILHLHSRVPAWVGYLAWLSLPKVQRPRLVTTVHGLYSVSAYSAIMTKGEAVVAVSDTVVDYITQHYPRCATARIELIKLGVDRQYYQPQFKPEQDWLDDLYHHHPSLKNAPILMLPGRLTRLKGHTTFIELIAQLKQHNPRIRGLIVGGVDPKRRAYADQLQQLVKQHQLSEQIIFMGHRSDMRELYAIADIVCALSTQAEAFGRTALEALAVGTAVLGWNIGGIGENLQRYYPAGCVANGDTQALQTQALHLLQYPPKPPSSLPQQQDSEAALLALYRRLIESPRFTFAH